MHAAHHIYDEVQKAEHRAVIAWERIMREIDEAEPSTTRRRLSALSSLFKHLVRHGHAQSNPVVEVERPGHQSPRRLNARLLQGGCGQASLTRRCKTIEGQRDRATLSGGLKVGPRRAEIAPLSVEDLHQNRSFDSLWIVRKGGRRDGLDTAQRIRAYLAAADHADDFEGRCSAR